MKSNVENEMLKLKNYLVAYTPQKSKQWFVEDIEEVLIPKLETQLEYELTVEGQDE